MEGHTQSIDHVAVVTAMIVMSFGFVASMYGAEQSQKTDSSNVAGIVTFASDEGRKLFKDAAFCESYWLLAPCHVCQSDLSSCGVASSCAVLNSLKCDRPLSNKLGKFGWFTFENIFSPDVSAIVTRDKVSRSGMTLQQLGELVAVFTVDVETKYASDVSIAEFRKQLKRSLSNKAQRIIVNYSRPALSQEGGGHISPLGAYNDQEDMVLVLDTASYKYPWTWVPVETLWSAMSDQLDHESGRTRGFIVVTERE